MLKLRSCHPRRCHSIASHDHSFETSFFHLNVCLTHRQVNALLRRKARSFEPAVVWKASQAAAPMAAWVVANVKCVCVHPHTCILRNSFSLQLCLATSLSGTHLYCTALCICSLKLLIFAPFCRFSEVLDGVRPLQAEMDGLNLRQAGARERLATCQAELEDLDKQVRIS